MVEFAARVSPRATHISLADRIVGECSTQTDVLELGVWNLFFYKDGEVHLGCPVCIVLQMEIIINGILVVVFECRRL